MRLTKLIMGTFSVFTLYLNKIQISDLGNLISTESQFILHVSVTLASSVPWKDELFPSTESLTHSFPSVWKSLPQLFCRLAPSYPTNSFKKKIHVLRKYLLTMLSKVSHAMFYPSIMGYTTLSW